ncbi:MAG: PH domain-containing protein [Bacteroidetes bacterium]|nr:PH domain-containing protein [Bacteroidota bacterium]MBS1629697.1 PH domain-containing protein [Bacteroidota bacterium]
MKHFSATLDGLAKTLSFIVFAILIIPFVSILSLYGKSHNPALFIGPAVVLLAMFITMLYRVKGYELDTESLNILRAASVVKYPLHRIRAIRTVTTKELGFGIRTFGSGGFFGYLGKFYYRNIGHVTLYVTDRSKMLLITLDNDKKFLISPDDTAAFMAAFQERMKRH